MNRSARALIGYLPKDQAIALLNGGAAPPAATLGNLEERWRSYKRRTAERPLFAARSPIVESPSLAARRLLDAVSSRPEVQSAFAPHNWELSIVDLTVPVATFQPVINIDDALQRVEGVDSDWEKLTDLCLPQVEQFQFEGGFDQSQNAFTISSTNPNLRIMSFEVVDVPAAGPNNSPKKVFGFTVGLGSSYVQFAEYQGRWMVRDGHHRLYGLIKAGVKAIPAVTIHAKTFEETGAGRPGFFGFEQVFSERPPQLLDFDIDEYSAQVSVRALRKVVRIKADEFAFPV